ncbi:glycosyl hydrolase family 65 protein [Paenibacillus silagei]
MAAVLGFAGVRFDGQTVTLKPSLPETWSSIELPVILRGGSFRLRIGHEEITVTAAPGNSEAVSFAGFGGEVVPCPPGAILELASESNQRGA